MHEMIKEIQSIEKETDIIYKLLYEDSNIK